MINIKLIWAVLIYILGTPWHCVSFAWSWLAPLCLELAKYSWICCNTVTKFAFNHQVVFLHVTPINCLTGSILVHKLNKTESWQFQVYLTSEKWPDSKTSPWIISEAALRHLPIKIVHTFLLSHSFSVLFYTVNVLVHMHTLLLIQQAYILHTFLLNQHLHTFLFYSVKISIYACESES